jgi:hypothetical protein
MRNPFDQIKAFFEKTAQSVTETITDAQGNIAKTLNINSEDQTPKTPSKQELSAVGAVLSAINRRSDPVPAPAPARPAPAQAQPAQAPARAAPAPTRPAQAPTRPAPAPARAAQAPTRPDQAPTRPAPAPAIAQPAPTQQAPSVSSLTSFFETMFGQKEVEKPKSQTPKPRDQRVALFGNAAQNRSSLQPTPTPSTQETSSTQKTPSTRTSSSTQNPLNQAKVSNISPMQEARNFYDVLEKNGNGKFDFSLIKENQDKKTLCDHINKKMNFWKDTLNRNSINPSDITVNLNMTKAQMLLECAKFLKENIEKTKSTSMGTEMGKALQTSQEFEMAKLHYFVGAIDQTGLQSPEAQIYYSTSKDARDYASRKAEPIRSDPSGIMTENEFIKNINVPPKLEVKNMEKADDPRIKRIELTSLSDAIGKIKIGKPLATSKSLPPEKQTSSKNLPSSSVTKVQSTKIKKSSIKSEDGENLRKKIDGTALTGYNHKVNTILNESLVIGENSIERRMANIEKSLFGIDNGRTFNPSDAKSEAPDKKEYALIEYVGFLKENINLVKNEIKLATNKDRKFKLQRLQFGLFGEIGKIRGLFPDNIMSQEEKQDEASKLKDSLSHNFGKIDTSQGRVYVKGSDGNINTISKISQSTRDSVDKKIKSIVSSVNIEEKLLERGVSITNTLGIEPSKKFFSGQDDTIGQGTFLRPTPGRGGGGR